MSLMIKPAQMFKALGDPTRLALYQQIVCCGWRAMDDSESANMPGLTVGEVISKVADPNLASSRVSFHLKELRSAGLINMERQGRFIVCSANTEALHYLRNYFVTCHCGEASLVLNASDARVAKTDPNNQKQETNHE